MVEPQAMCQDRHQCLLEQFEFLGPKNRRVGGNAYHVYRAQRDLQQVAHIQERCKASLCHLPFIDEAQRSQTLHRSQHK